MVNQIDITNESAFLYTQAVRPQIIDICDPLKCFNMKNFGYLKIFTNSAYLRLGSTPLEYQKRFLKIPTLTKTLEEPAHQCTKSTDTYFIWPTKITKDPIISLAHEYNIWHGVTIYYKNFDHIELFSFSFDCSHDDKTNFFINNVECLTQFSQYFKLKARHLINCSDQRRLAMFKDGLDLKMFDDPTLSQEKNQEKPIKFSKQENNCIKFLAQGRTMKEVGRILNLSPRTVESYIRNIKNKTGLNYKSQIVDLFWNNKSNISTNF